MTTQTGGPAFPLPLGTMNCAEPNESGGMTLRDYFAAKALQDFWEGDIGRATKEDAANWSYAMADAMLKARAAS